MRAFAVLLPCSCAMRGSGHVVIGAVAADRPHISRISKFVLHSDLRSAVGVSSGYLRDIYFRCHRLRGGLLYPLAMLKCTATTAKNTVKIAIFRNSAKTARIFSLCKIWGFPAQGALQTHLLERGLAPRRPKSWRTHGILTEFRASSPKIEVPVVYAVPAPLQYESRVSAQAARDCSRTNGHSRHCFGGKT